MKPLNLCLPYTSLNYLTIFEKNSKKCRKLEFFTLSYWVLNLSFEIFFQNVQFASLYYNNHPHIVPIMRGVFSSLNNTQHTIPYCVA